MVSKVLKSGIWYTASNFLVKGIGFITIPIFTRIMTQSDFGVFNNWQSWLSVFTVLTTLELSSSIISAKYDFEDCLDDYCLTIVVFQGGISLILLIFANVFEEQFSALLLLDSKALNLMFLYLVLSPAITVFQTYERYQYEYKKTVAISLLVSIASALLAVILVVYCEDKLLGRIIGQVLPSGIIGLCLAGYFVSKGARINLRLLGYALPLALPLVPHGLAGVILGTFDRVMITRMIGFEAAALYSVAYSCGMIIMVLASSLNQAYSPYIGDMVEFQRKGELRRKTMLYVSGFLMFAIIIMLLAPEVLWVLGGENYSAALYAIPVVSLGCVFQFIYTLYVDLELKQKKTIYIAIATLAAAAVNLVLNMVFIPLMGYFGAACTTAIGYGCLLLFHYFIARDIGGAEYFSTAFNCLIVCVAVLAALGSSLLYGDQIMRYSCLVIWILAITILVIVKRNEIRGFLDASRKD